MAYARFDDRYDDHRKIKRAWRRFPANPVGLHSQAITYCNRHETDGVIDIDWLEEKVPKVVERDRIVAYMVEHEMLERLDDERFYVHDFLDWNESKEQRETLREAGRRGAEARWGRKGRRAKASSPPNADRIADGIGGPSAGANSSPHHTTPHHTFTPGPASGETGTDEDSSPAETTSSMPSLTPPAMRHTGKRRQDQADHDAATQEWQQAWDSWLALPPNDRGVAAAARAMSALRAEAPSALASIGELHAHRGEPGLLLLGATGPVADPNWIVTRYGKLIERALDLPPDARWEMVKCGCAATPTEVAA